MQDELTRETITKLHKHPLIPEATLKIIIGNPKFFVPRAQKPEERTSSRSSSPKIARPETEKQNLATQVPVTNKYSIAALTAPKNAKVSEVAVQERKVAESAEEVWKVRQADEVWSFAAVDKAHRFVVDNFGDVKGVCVENIKTGVLYTKNKFIELFGEKGAAKNDKSDINASYQQMKNPVQQLPVHNDDSDSEEDFGPVYGKNNNRLEQNKPAPLAANKDLGAPYGDYNMWRNKNSGRPDGQLAVGNPGPFGAPGTRQMDTRGVKEVSDFGGKNQQRQPIADAKGSRYEMFQRPELDKNKYQQRMNEVYARKNNMYEDDIDSEEDDDEEEDFDVNEYRPEHREVEQAHYGNTYNGNTKKPEPQSKNIFNDLSKKQGAGSNFIELEKLLDAYNVSDHDTFLLELRRYISLNKLTDIGFNVPNPSKNIDFQIDIDNSDNEVEHKMTQIQIDQCINKLLSEYVKLSIGLIKKYEMKNKGATEQRRPKPQINSKNDFVITKVLDEESIKRLLARDEASAKQNQGFAQPGNEYAGYNQQKPRYAPPPQHNKYPYEGNRGPQAYNQPSSQQEYTQSKYQTNNYNKYGGNDMSKVPKEPHNMQRGGYNNAPRAYNNNNNNNNNQQFTDRIGKPDRAPNGGNNNNGGKQRDMREPKNYPTGNYRHY